MSDEYHRCRCGLSAGTALCLAFIVLKLCHVIDWSWWWILVPMAIGVIKP